MAYRGRPDGLKGILTDLEAGLRREGHSETEIKRTLELVIEFRNQLQAVREHEIARWRDLVDVLDGVRVEMRVPLHFDFSTVNKSPS
jgi:hypothetical protein